MTPTPTSDSRAPGRNAAPGDDAPLQVLRSAERASALLDPARRRLVEALLEAPDSAAGLARRLGEKRQTINYHLRALEDAHLVELAEERRRGNCTERVLRPVATRFVLDSAALGTLGTPGARTGDRFSATWLIAVAARAIRDVAELVERAARERQRLATTTVEAQVRLASPEAFGRFSEELAEAVARVVARWDDGGTGSRPFRVIAAAHPGAGDETSATGGSEGRPRSGVPS